MEQTPTRQLANAYAPLQVSTPEATAVDLVQYAPRLGGIGRVAETIAPLVSLMRPAELRRVLKTTGEPAAAQRLGFVLEFLKAPALAKAVADWLPSDLMCVPLVPGGRREASEIKRWRILNNAGEFAS